MKPETLFLKVVVIFMGLPILAACFFLPGIAADVAEFFPELAYMRYPGLIGMFGTAIAYFVALYQTLRLLSYIDTNVAFSELSVRALANIKYCAITISIIYVIGLPFIFQMAQEDDAPGLAALGLIIVFASIVIAVFAAVLQKLLKHAIDIKSDNDLTV